MVTIKQIQRDILTAIENLQLCPAAENSEKEIDFIQLPDLPIANEQDLESANAELAIPVKRDQMVRFTFYQHLFINFVRFEYTLTIALFRSQIWLESEVKPLTRQLKVF